MDNYWKGKPHNGVDAPFFEFENLDEYNKLRDIWKEKIGGKSGFDHPTDYRWFRPDDLITSVRHAIILRMMADVTTHGCQWVRDAVMWRDFMMAVLGDVPFVTKHKEVTGLVAAAVQMVHRGPADERINLYKHFINDE